MTTREILRVFALPSLRPVQPAATARFLESSGRRTARPPRPADLERLHADIQGTWRGSPDLGELPPRLFRKSPWVLFFPPSAPPRRWLGSNPAFFRAFSRRFEADFSALLCRRLLTALLHSWPARKCPLLPDWCKLVRQAVLASHSPLLAGWREREAKVHFLAPDGNNRLARHLFQKRVDPRAELAAWGFLDGLLGQSGFLEHTFLSACDLPLRKKPSPRKALEELRALVGLLESTPDGTLRFPRSAPAYVTKLLQPCVDDPGRCAGEIRQALQAFATRHLGDPRLKPGKWADVPDSILNLVLRWLTEESIDLFLEMISRHAVPHQWKERRDLWKKYFSQGVIEEAWVALGMDPHEDLVVSCRRQKTRVPPHARLTGVNTDQSVLLLRMQGWTIVEWSHNGACRFYAPDSRTAPRLYRREYSGQDVRADRYVDRVPHLGSDWVKKIDRFIQNEILP